MRLLVDIPEAAGLEEARCNWPVTEEKIAQAGDRRPMRLGIFVVGMIAGAFADDAEIEMILEIRSDAWEIAQRPYAERRQMIGGPEAGLHQQFRGTDRARRQDDFAVGMDDAGAAIARQFDADRASAIEYDAAYNRVALDREIGARQGRFQERARR